MIQKQVGSVAAPLKQLQVAPHRRKGVGTDQAAGCCSWNPNAWIA